mmetsp:Transcript_9521/g.26312  ORF Transcript_9521/g.26312 Transcript_9521/m.26312 type:complete len:85 (+) Transcript_9521:581-835(+)
MSLTVVVSISSSAKVKSRHCYAIRLLHPVVGGTGKAMKDPNHHSGMPRHSQSFDSNDTAKKKTEGGALQTVNEILTTNEGPTDL